MAKAAPNRIKLDDKKVENMPLPSEVTQVEYLDTLMPGLRLRVSSKGAKTWTVLTRALVAGEKKLVRTTLGHYPAMKLALARDAAAAYMRAVQEGVDPRAAKAAREAAKVEESRNTFGAVRDRFLKEKAKGVKALKANTLDEYERVLKSADFADWENRPLKVISRAQVRSVIDQIEGRVSSVTANKAFVYLRAMLNWAVEKDVLTAAPTDRMEPPAGAEARTRVLSDDELRILWAALPAAGVFEVPYKLLALTGQRRDEIVSLRWDEIRDLDGADPRIEFPPKRAKNKLPHVVPLAPLAANLLRKVKEARTSPDECPYVFTTTGKTPLSGFSRIKRTLDGAIVQHADEAIAAARESGDVDRAEALNRAFFAERHHDQLREALATAEKAGDEDEVQRLTHLLDDAWRLHDLRRTLVTGLNSKGVAPHVVEAVVNHVSGAAKAGVAGVYNHALYMPERRAALEMWARHIENLMNPSPTGAKVIEMQAVRSA
ncbi:integrase arm-type DNA-binding domain-containing protein [Burkholderia sp. AU31624]|uniref:tyrosine-type recombinase/integrase n=1 Tax=Burkholderia sp. AU31624 TaxID=2879629 RepID=UPI001CF25E16|nr:site-specific integrase [Burkholderia sp. AU31624]MCA8254823.1 integrase arm-type DNA-binding domain-containing protein [Burkholderia sp. AU31624]